MRSSPQCRPRERESRAYSLLLAHNATLVRLRSQPFSRKKGTRSALRKEKGTSGPPPLGPPPGARPFLSPRRFVFVPVQILGIVCHVIRDKLFRADPAILSVEPIQEQEGALSVGQRGFAVEKLVDPLSRQAEKAAEVYFVSPFFQVGTQGSGQGIPEGSIDSGAKRIAPTGTQCALELTLGRTGSEFRRFRNSS